MRDIFSRTLQQKALPTCYVSSGLVSEQAPKLLKLNIDEEKSNTVASSVRHQAKADD
jgi:hypothetical protein